MPSNLKPITVQNFVVTLNGATGLSGSIVFSKASAPRFSRPEAAYNDGQTGQEKATYGFSKREKLTLSKAYDPVADDALEVWAQKAVEQPQDNSDFTVTVLPVQSDVAGTPIAQAKPRVYTGCQVVSFRMSDVDRTSSNLAMLELEIYFQNSTKQ
jgi:hypothetical protein